MKGRLEKRGGFLSGVSVSFGVKTREIVEVSVDLDRLHREQPRDPATVDCSGSVASRTAERSCDCRLFRIGCIANSRETLRLSTDLDRLHREQPRDHATVDCSAAATVTIPDTNLF